MVADFIDSGGRGANRISGVLDYHAARRKDEPNESTFGGTYTLASFSILSRELTDLSSMSLVYSRLFYSLKVQLPKHWMF